MKTERKIFIVFLLNLIFSIFEFLGGIFTGSIAILSDALHDFGDASSVGLSFILEKKSKKKANDKFTYGYRRFSVLGGIITMLILLLGGIVVIYNSVARLFNPIEIKYDTVILIAVIGFIVNLISTIFTHGGHSINQKAINLHMLEDVLGWVIVLIGAIVMRFTNFYLLDPIMSIIVALFIIFNALKSLKDILEIFLLKTPKDVSVNKIKSAVLSIDNVLDVRDVRILNLDNEQIFISLNVVTNREDFTTKKIIKHVLFKLGASYVTLEISRENEEIIEKPNEEPCKDCNRFHHHNLHHH